MILGIDASNIRAGGGLTHLRELLNNVDLNETGFKQVVIWASENTLDQIQDQKWLVKKSHRLINYSSVSTLLWQLLFLNGSAKRMCCTIIFAPGSTFISRFRPFVTISQNMLPFELNEAFRFKSWLTRLRFLVLHLTQSFTFKRASGLIFLSHYAKSFISAKIKLSNDHSVIIPHGIHTSFLQEPKEQKDISEYYHRLTPFRIIYISIVTAYKHQWNVVEAVGSLRKLGYPVVLDLVGPITKESKLHFEQSINNIDPSGEFIHYTGPVPHSELSQYYKKSDLFVFASSCENLPIILLEAMSAGLPIACSNRGPMPEVLKDAGIYFDPENIDSIIKALQHLINNKEIREKDAMQAFNEVKNYTWHDCTKNTFRYLHDIAISEKKER